MKTIEALKEIKNQHNLTCGVVYAIINYKQLLIYLF